MLLPHAIFPPGFSARYSCSSPALSTALHRNRFLHLDAAVHNRDHIIRSGNIRCLLADDPLLEPEHACTDISGFLRHSRAVFTAAEHIHNVYRFRNFRQRMVAFLAQNLAVHIGQFQLKYLKPKLSLNGSSILSICSCVR